MHDFGKHPLSDRAIGQLSWSEWKGRLEMARNEAEFLGLFHCGYGVQCTSPQEVVARHIVYLRYADGWRKDHVHQDWMKEKTFPGVSPCWLSSADTIIKKAFKEFSRAFLCKLPEDLFCPTALLSNEFQNAFFWFFDPERGNIPYWEKDDRFLNGVRTSLENLCIVMWEVVEMGNSRLVPLWDTLDGEDGICSLRTKRVELLKILYYLKVLHRLPLGVKGLDDVLMGETLRLLTREIDGGDSIPSVARQALLDNGLIRGIQGAQFLARVLAKRRSEGISNAEFFPA